MLFAALPTWLLRLHEVRHSACWTTSYRFTSRGRFNEITARGRLLEPELLSCTLTTWAATHGCQHIIMCHHSISWWIGRMENKEGRWHRLTSAESPRCHFPEPTCRPGAISYLLPLIRACREAMRLLVRSGSTAASWAWQRLEVEVADVERLAIPPTAYPDTRHSLNKPLPASARVPWSLVHAYNRSTSRFARSSTLAVVPGMQLGARYQRDSRFGPLPFQ